MQQAVAAFLSIATLGTSCTLPLMRPTAGPGECGGGPGPVWYLPSCLPAVRPSGNPAPDSADSRSRRTRRPAPDYFDNCAPVGIDTSSPCLRITLDAIDHARAKEGLQPMVLPADFPRLSVPEQLFVAVNRERVDRGLAPFNGLTVALNAGAQKGADTAALPTSPGASYPSSSTEWIGDVDNGLDADFEWVYDDGLGSGVPGCSGNKTAGCWSDRRVVLGRLGSHALVMGAAYDPSGDTSKEDRGGVVAGGHAGRDDERRTVRLHLEGGFEGHGRRDAPAAAGDPLLGIRHRRQRPPA